MKSSGRLRRVLIALAVVVALPIAAHWLIVGATTMTPPDVLGVSAPQVVAAPDDPERRVLGRSYARKRGKINEARLVGGPTELGVANIALLREQQTHIERHMHDQFSHYVPWAPVRTLIVDLARLRFRNLDDNLSGPHLQEIAAQAAAFGPDDPFTDLMGTFQRFVFLHSLYDIMLSFERSPLVGCTSFVLNGHKTASGHTLVGRNFDFEGPPVLDEHKAVFLVLEEGRIPYASVMWPGFIGTASGMNYEGVAIVIHGARAGETRATGEPVAQTVRDVLARARTTAEALTLIGRRDPMVSHMLLVADARGDTAVIERVPGRRMHVRRHSSAAGERVPLTNHLEGPLANDRKNRDVLEKTSTIPRRKRLDELLQNLPATADVQDAVRILRDKRALGGAELPLGHRSAIDALIATHSIVMDTTSRTLWVNEGPHATGRYVKFDLRRLLDPAYEAEGPARVETLPQDDIVTNGSYDEWVGQGSPHSGAE